MGPLVWRVLGTGSAIMAGKATRGVVTKIWTKTTGRVPPANPMSPSTSWGEAVAWAVVSGAIVQVGRMLATRQAAKYYKHSAGHLPKGMQEVS